MIRRSLVLLVFTGLALSQLVQARAETLISTFGAGDTFQSTSQRFVSGPSTFLGYQASGILFTAAADRLFTGIDIAGTYISGTNSFLVQIAPDVAGQPGTPLESWTTAFPSAPASVTALSSLSNPLLAAGASYWVTIQPTAPNTRGGWNLNDQGINTGNMRSQGSSSSTPWVTVASADVAYRVSGVAAPEPGVLTLVALSSPLFLFLHRRKHS